MANSKTITGPMKLGRQPPAPVTDLKVENYSHPVKAHLPPDVVIRFVGPLPPNGDFQLVAIGPNHEWVINHHSSAENLGSDIYAVTNVPVAGSQHSVVTSHYYVMVVEEKDSDGCPTSVYLSSPSHALALHMGSTGTGETGTDPEPQHFGSVHLTN